MCEDRYHEREANQQQKEPITRDAATINPQSAIVTGLAGTASTDVRTAAATPTLRSSSKGNETTLMLSAITAKAKPIALPRTIRAQPWVW